jgi:prophage DNA circulation protein
MTAMTGSARGLQRASFAGIEFPVSSVTVKGGLREHVHEYPHVAGGAPEKLGRKLYEVTMVAEFHDVIPEYGSSLWPGSLADLLNFFELETTEDLVIPTVGKIQAYAVEWDKVWEAKRQSGERATFHFREDSGNAFLASEAVASISGISALGAYNYSLYQASGYQSSIFDAINDAVNAITSITDQAEMFGNLVEAKALALASLCDQADASVKFLQDPVNHRILDALLELWAAAIRLQKDAALTALTVINWTVPSPMAVSDVSRALYGDSARAVDILQMNAIEDAFNIPSGQVLRVVAPPKAA